MILNKPKYTQTKNGNSFYVDLSKRIEEMKHTNERARSSAYNPEPVLKMRYNQPIFSSIAVISGADTHSGTVGANDIKEEKSILFVYNTSNSIYIPGGDQLNITTKSGVDNFAEMKYNNQRAIDRKIALYTPIRKKIPCIIDGNHDGANGNRLLDSNMSPSKHVADALKITHVEFGVLIESVMPTADHSREKVPMYIFAFHGSGKTSGQAKSVDITFEKAMNSLLKEGIIPDVIIAGHFHSNSNGFIPMEIPIYDERGKVVSMKRKDVIVISESTLQENSRYAVTAGFPPSDSNVYINNLSMVKNPNYNINTQDRCFKYMAELTRIPMFRKDSEAYTEEAKEYMRNYQEPFELEDAVRSKYEGLSYNKSYKALQTEFKDVKDYYNLDNIDDMGNN